MHEDISFTDAQDRPSRSRVPRCSGRRIVGLFVSADQLKKPFGGGAPEYSVFTGEQRGLVVDSEANFDTNPVYPWLDNQSFNKMVCARRF